MSIRPFSPEEDIRLSISLLRTAKVLEVRQIPAGKAIEFRKMLLSDGTWYFAYGSNMSYSVLARRQLHPLRIEPACCEGYTLCFNVHGMPYTEPAMGGICKRFLEHQESVHGVAYLLAEDEFRHLIASEG